MNNLQTTNDFEKTVRKNAVGSPFFRVVAEIGENSKLALTTATELVNAVLKGQLINYSRNRGSGKISTSRVEEIVKNFNVDDLGQITVAYLGDGYYQLRDGHHRVYALLALYEQGKLPGNDVGISLRIVPESEKMRAYANLNNVRSHSLKDKVTNEDLGLGKLIKKVLVQADLAPELGVTILDDRKKSLIGQILISIAEMEDSKNTDFSNMIRYSGKRIKAVSNELPEDFSVKLSGKDATDIVAAINFAITAMKYFIKLEDLNKGQKSTASLSSSGQNIVSNGMLFAAIVWDKYTDRHTFGQLDPKTIGKKLSDKVDDAVVAASLMSAKKYSEAFQFFFRIIRTKETNVLGLQK